MTLGRRTAISGGLATIVRSRHGHAQGRPAQISAELQTARTTAPEDATDCHFFTYDRRYPAAAAARLLPPDALPADYRSLQARLGLKRGVLVQPSTYGTDNSLQLASMAALGPERFRMVAVVPETVPDAELSRLHALGVRGVRFNLAEPGPLTLASLPVLAPRLADLGWVAQVNLAANQLADSETILTGLPGRLVIDHLGHVSQPAGIDSPSFAIMRRMLDTGRTYVKLSGAYMSSKDGPPDYADAGRVAAAFVQAAPERVIWGTDWPHPTVAGPKPDDAVLFDRLAQWAGSPQHFKLILSDNPAALYGFSAS